MRDVEGLLLVLLVAALIGMTGYALVVDPHGDGFKLLAPAFLISVAAAVAYAFKEKKP